MLLAVLRIKKGYFDYRSESESSQELYYKGTGYNYIIAFAKPPFFEVNGKVVTIPSMQLKEGDIIKPVDFGKIHLREGFVLPDWLEANVKEKYVKFSRLPNLEDTLENINVQVIIEFYSR